ncbi:TPA: hypothetical protein QDC20_007529 [Burkholderia aenigmatica]|uniref:hypothetical protein n=1 Tax=Burkholderia sp. AU45251 TaxID=3059204 RepID=UPI002655013B|nr:hypothetical protein [Burkholderia sp. AU45251]HDR9485547.1 hypothetical protein [Burkholderia aenigmatica]MDN7518122.1 hypothetical protein [Burkholderia sp. AU45251]HDR9520023.1 hypothetical protein [Burkholderia aenigmatica]HDR9597148.1 hypothetical protein [Burkholderia aenigmatica]HDR9604998.1 hypothetical protein [Burkholderia aenigmatica]
MNFDVFHLFSHADQSARLPVRPADTTRERLQWRNAVSQACMPRHFNNLENLIETAAPDNPALDYTRMKSSVIDNRREGAAFD